MKERWIRNNWEYRYVYREGEKQVGGKIIVYAVDRRGELCRYGIAVSKKIGNAVTRNRVKRRLREVIRSYLYQNEGNYDRVIVARKVIIHSSYQEILRECKILIERSGGF